MKNTAIGKLGTVLILTLAFTSVIGSARAMTTDGIKERRPDPLKTLNWAEDMKAQGFSIGNGIYLCKAEVANETGFGLVVDRKTYAWGINNRGISFLKRF